MVVDSEESTTTSSIKQSTISITSNKSQDPRNKWVHSFDDTRKKYIQFVGVHVDKVVPTRTKTCC